MLRIEPVTGLDWGETAPPLPPPPPPPPRQQQRRRRRQAPQQLVDDNSREEEQPEDFRGSGLIMCSSEGSGAGAELDGTQSSHSSTDCTTPNSPDRSKGSFDSASEGMRPGLASLIAKDARSLTFQWEKGQSRVCNAEEPVVVPQAITYSAEIRQVDLSCRTSTLDGEAAEPSHDVDGWTCVYRGSESWTQVSKLRPGTCYAVRIIESLEESEANGGNTTPYCSEVAFFTTTPTTPEAPHAPLLQRRHTHSLKLKWPEPLESGGDEDLDYVLEIRPPPNGVTCPSDNQGFATIYRGRRLGCKVSHLIPGTSYAFRVKASNDVGDSPWSTISRYRTKSPAPREPIRLHALQTIPMGQNDGQTLFFEWFKPIQGGPNPTSFSLEVEDMVSGSKSIVYRGPNPFGYVSGLNAAWEYSARVKAENQHGSSGWSFPYHFYTNTALPCAPRDATITEITESTVVLQWTPPLRGHGCIVDLYTVELLPLTTAKDEPGEDAWQSLYQDKDPGCKLTDLAGGTKYRLKIRAVSKISGAGPCAFLDFETQPSVPDTPGLPYAIERKSTALLIEWKAPEHDGGRPITEYCVEIGNADQLVSLDEAIKFETAYRGTLATAEMTNLKPDSLYAIRIQAINDIGSSLWSELNYESTQEAPPKKPSPPVAKASSTSLKVEWNAPLLDNTEKLMYELELIDMPTLQKFMGHGTDGRHDRTSTASCNTFISVATESNGEDVVVEEPPFESVYNGRGLSCSIDGLVANTEYIMRLRCQNNAGYSEWSEHVIIMTLPIIPHEPPLLVVKEIALESITMQWTPAEEVATLMSGLEYTVEIAERLGRKLNWTTVYEGANTECCATGLTCGREYHLRMHAHNDMGQGPYCKTLTVQTLLPKPEKPDSPVVVHKTPTSARVQWSTTMTAGSATKCHRLEMAREGEDFFEVYSGSNLTHQVSELKPGNTYQFRLCGTNAAGDGCWSELSKLTTPLKCPNPPTGVRVDEESLSPTSNVVSVSWDPVPAKQEGHEEIWQYEVEAIRGNVLGKGKTNKNGSTPQKITATTKKNSCKLSGFIKGTTYTLRVHAIGVQKSCGKWSVPIKAQIPLEKQEVVTQSATDSVQIIDEIASIKPKPSQAENLDHSQSASPKIGSYKGRTEARAVPKHTIVRRSPQVRPRRQKKIFYVRKMMKSTNVLFAVAIAFMAIAYFMLH